MARNSEHSGAKPYTTSLFELVLDREMSRTNLTECIFISNPASVAIPTRDSIYYSIQRLTKTASTLIECQ